MRNKRSLTAAPRPEPKPKATRQGAHRVSNSRPNHGRKLLRGQGRG